MDRARNKEIFKKMATERILLVKIRNRQLKFFVHSEKGRLGKLKPHGHIEGKRDKGQQIVTYLMSLYECLVECSARALAKGEKLMKLTREKKLWRAMTAFVLKGHNT